MEQNTHHHYSTVHYSTHENIVSIIDMYENSFEGTACLLLVVEFLEGGDLLTRFESQGSRAYSEHGEEEEEEEKGGG